MTSLIKSAAKLTSSFLAILMLIMAVGCAHKDNYAQGTYYLMLYWILYNVGKPEADETD